MVRNFSAEEFRKSSAISGNFRRNSAGNFRTHNPKFNVLIILQFLSTLPYGPSPPPHIEMTLCQRISDRWLIAERTRWPHSSLSVGPTPA